MKESIGEKILDIVRMMVSDGQVSQEVAEKYFPELKKTDDEGIKRELTEMLSDCANNIEHRFTASDCKRWLDWVEKQGEQKPADEEMKALLRTEYEKGRADAIAEMQQPWSEEDERMFNSAIWHVKNSCGNGGKNSGEFEVYNWLKSLKDRYTWKPSEEQMMTKAVDGDITFDYYGDDDKTYGCIAHNSFCLEDFGLKDGDKVKVIVIKED